MCDVFLVQASTKIIYFMYIYLFTESNVQNYARSLLKRKLGGGGVGSGPPYTERAEGRELTEG